MKEDYELMFKKIKLEKLFNMEVQMSDALVLNVILAFSGGFQDAYTYIVRGKVFANAQTGNLVLMSTYFMGGKWEQGFKYLFPIFSFMLGVFIADIIQHRFKMAKKIHWRQGIVLFEALIMVIVSFLPQEYNMLANCMISFSCAMQLQAFRKVRGSQYASTMCIGNMKSLVLAFSSYLRTRSVADFLKIHDYLAIIILFCCGAGVGGNCSMLYNETTIWGSAVLMVICFFMMMKEKINVMSTETFGG